MGPMQSALAREWQLAEVFTFLLLLKSINMCASELRGGDRPMVMELERARQWYWLQGVPLSYAARIHNACYH